MTHSLESLLGDDLAVRTFFSLPPIWEDQALRGNASWIQRSDPFYHGPWIIAITAPLILRIPVWVGKIMPTTGSWNRHRVISSCDVSRIVLGSFWMERGNPAGAAGVVRRCRLLFVDFLLRCILRLVDIIWDSLGCLHRSSWRSWIVWAFEHTFLLMLASLGRFWQFRGYEISISRCWQLDTSDFQWDLNHLNPHHSRVFSGPFSRTVPSGIGSIVTGWGSTRLWASSALAGWHLGAVGQMHCFGILVVQGWTSEPRCRFLGAVWRILR